MNAISSFIYNALEWITRLAYLNLLWIFFTLLGGVIFGFFPSTTSMFAIVREWLKGETEIPLFSTFWKHFKEEFMKSNLLGVLVTLIIVIIGLDIIYIQSTNSDLLTWTYLPLFAFMLLFIMFLFYLFPSFVHFNLKLGQVIKNSFFIMLINPITTLLIFLCLLPFFYLISLLPAIGIIFGGSVYAFISMRFSLHAFQKVSDKQEALKVSSEL
ncbi:YesL family protein [Psychrobacillus psychrotolerans]|uniref:YesL family protein n=1 Tax=Psychrobacillus psychrotolerans TaxID=126156 RepID=UPI0039892940